MKIQKNVSRVLLLNFIFILKIAYLENKEYFETIKESQATIMKELQVEEVAE